MKLILASLLCGALAWSRYHPKDGVYKAKETIPKAPFTCPAITPFAAHPIQDKLYGVLAYFHCYSAVPLVILLGLQWLRPKGDPVHIQIGRVAKWLLVFMVANGWAIHVRHSFLSKESAFEEYPAVIPTVLARHAITLLGGDLAGGVIHAFWVGVPDPTRRIKVGSVLFWCLCAINVGTFVVALWMYAYILGVIITNPWFGNYNFEICVNMGVTFSFMTVYQVFNLWVLAGWYKTGELNWKEHHVMNMVFMSSDIIGTVGLFVSSDARYIFSYPGITTSWVRLLIVAGPAVMFVLPMVPRMFRYLTLAGPNQEKPKHQQQEEDRHDLLAEGGKYSRESGDGQTWPSRAGQSDAGNARNCLLPDACCGSTLGQGM